MTTFKSPKVTVNKSSEELFNKIGDLNNLKQIMPTSVNNFQSTQTTCSFTMEGMPQINLEITKRIPFSKITLSAKNSQIPFSLDCIISAKEDKCEAFLEINAKLNFMTKMMVEKPLNNFLNLLSSKLKNV